MLSVSKNKDIIEQIIRLDKRIVELRQSKCLFLDFLLQAHLLQQQHAKKVKVQISIFEENLFRNSFHSQTKYKEMRTMVQIYQYYSAFMEAMAKVNIADLKRVNSDSSSKEKRLSVKTANFSNQLTLYLNDELKYNQHYSQYDAECRKLNDLLKKFKSYQNPIYFYNLTKSGQFSKNLDKQFQLCQNLQTNIINKLQVLDQKRKLLSENLTQIKDQYLYLIHSHLENVKKSVEYLVDSSKDQMYEGIRNSKNCQIFEDDIFSEQFQRLNEKYTRNDLDDDEILSNLKDFFGNAPTSIEISLDYKLFLDRCEIFKKKKYESVQQILSMQKNFLKQINFLLKFYLENDKNYNQLKKEIYKSNGIDNYKKRFRIFFGENFLSIVELSLTVLENPKKRSDKMKKFLVSHEEKIRKIIQTKQEQVKIFKKRVNMILEEHNNTKRSLQSQSKKNIESIAKFKNSVQKSFSNFRDVIKQFIKVEKNLDLSFDREIIDLKNYILKQSKHSLLGFLLNREKEKMRLETLKKLIVQNQIVSIMKEDSRYEILFIQPLKSELFKNFQSQIEKEKYQQTKNVLKRKQYQSRCLLSMRNIGCCGMRPSIQFKAGTDYKCSLIHDKKQKKGTISISTEGVAFVQQSLNPFSSLTAMMVPQNQIISFNKKLIQGKTGFQIETRMGSINFQSDEGEEIVQKFQTNFGNRVSMQAKKDRKSESSSSFHKNNSSTQFRMSYESTCINPPVRVSSRKDKALSVKCPFFQSWIKEKFWSEKFSLAIQKKSQKNTIREDFFYKDELTSFLLKEKRSGSFSKDENSFIFQYEWKCSFPEAQMFKSYRHSEKFFIQTQGELLKILIIEKKHEEENLFVRKKFYTEVEKLNKRVCEFIVKNLQKQAQIIIEEQKEEESEIFVDAKEVGSEGKESRFSRMTSFQDFKIKQ